MIDLDFGHAITLPGIFHGHPMTSDSRIELSDSESEADSSNLPELLSSSDEEDNLES